MTQWFHDRRTRPHDAEPARDVRLASLLREVDGEPAISDADWRRLADRIGRAVRAYPDAPWWSYAERWRRGAVPLALAAGLVGAIALWGTRPSSSAEPAATSGSSDLVTAVLSGTPTAEAASSFASAVTSTVDFTEDVLP
jgi:hypothetical protein